MTGPPARTLARALEIVGSRVALAEALRVSPAELEAWLDDEEPLPHKVFIAALDIVAAGTVAPRAAVAFRLQPAPTRRQLNHGESTVARFAVGHDGSNHRQERHHCAERAGNLRDDS